jgi:hypothetical protein
MDTDAHEWESDLTEVVTGAAFEVANVIGAGFLEKVYERALRVRRRSAQDPRFPIRILQTALGRLLEWLFHGYVR